MAAARDVVSSMQKQHTGPSDMVYTFSRSESALNAVDSKPLEAFQ